MCPDQRRIMDVLRELDQKANDHGRADDQIAGRKARRMDSRYRGEVAIFRGFRSALAMAARRALFAPQLFSLSPRNRLRAVQ